MHDDEKIAKNRNRYDDGFPHNRFLNEIGVGLNEEAD